MRVRGEIRVVAISACSLVEESEKRIFFVYREIGERHLERVTSEPDWERLTVENHERSSDQRYITQIRLTEKKYTRKNNKCKGKKSNQQGSTDTYESVDESTK